MANRGSINKVMLIGNVVRDPEVKETSPGVVRAVITVATNRVWKTEAGEDKEETQFHRIVAWQKLADVCQKLLTKGRKIYVEGRLSTQEWEDQDGQKRKGTEIVMESMTLLDSQKENRDGEDPF